LNNYRPNFTKHGIGAYVDHSYTRSLFQSSDIGPIAAFANAGGSKLNDVENDAKFRTFSFYPVKIRGGLGEISIGLPIVETLPTTETPF